jgi:hypothetical protein
MVGVGDYTFISHVIEMTMMWEKSPSPLTDSVVKRVMSNSMDDVTSPQKSSFASDREDRTRPMGLSVIESMATS